MRFISTRGGSPPAPLREALFRGLAPDGGLYMPLHLPKLSPDVLSQLPQSDWSRVSALVSQALFSEAIGSLEAEALAMTALNFPVPLVHLKDRISVLELFRGPTLAFKDVGARFMAGLLRHHRQEATAPTTVLTATSGDTGGAVAQAFHGLPGFRVVVLFPEGKVSVRQERQFSTLGGNVVAVAVDGDFDDCQRMAKEAFRERAEADLESRWGQPSLTSANSINVGRFLPQTTYFFESWARLREREGNRTKILFSVPSGNFGNLAAGMTAKAMGLSDVTFLAATNENDVVPRFLSTGSFQPKTAVPTLSTAMDVGDPSNLPRILHLYGHSLPELRGDLIGRRVSDSETADCIRRVYLETGYVLDPHSAVGYAAMEKELPAHPDTQGVVLATAHPAKFAETVEPILGSALPAPPELARGMEKERKVVRIPPKVESLMEIL